VHDSPSRHRVAPAALAEVEDLARYLVEVYDLARCLAGADGLARCLAGADDLVRVSPRGVAAL
jgi:hypothetical protein